MPGQRFRTTRKKAAKAAARPAGARPSEGVSVSWLLDRLGFDKDSFWQDPDPMRYIDSGVAIETVAYAHADAAFPQFLGAWDDVHDHKQEGKSFTGRLIATAMLHSGADWPLDRSWFHELFIDLARLDGALGIDLCSDDQLRHAVSSYWQRVGVLSRAHAAAVNPDREDDASPAAEDTEPQASFRQLVLL